MEASLFLFRRQCISSMLSSSTSNTESCEDQRKEKIKDFDVISFEDGMTYQKSVQVMLINAF